MGISLIVVDSFDVGALVGTVITANSSCSFVYFLLPWLRLANDKYSWNHAFCTQPMGGLLKFLVGILNSSVSV